VTTDVLQPGDRLTPAQRRRYVVILGFLSALGPFTIDLYLPAFPAVAADLMTTQAAIQFTLAGTTIGLAVGQLLVGPWSDRVGRKLPLVLATAVHVVSCLVAATAPSVEVLGVSRVIMGAAAAAGGIMALAMVRDLFVGLRMMKIVSQLAMIGGLAPIVAPLIGSQLLVVTSWRGIFVFLAGYSLIVGTVALLFIVETLPRSIRSIRPDRLGSVVRILLADRVYVGLLVVGGMVWGCEFSYLASTPFLFQEVYGFSTGAYALVFAVNAVGFVAGNQLSARIAHRLAPQWLLAAGTSVMVVAAAGVIVAQLTGLGAGAVMVALWFSVAAVGVCVPCLQVLGLARHGAHAGTAAAFMGASNFGIAALVTPLSGMLQTGDALGMGVLMLAASLIASVALWAVVRPSTVLALPR
jgi:DHA1 family bicyclomycin/chloramphenicol resistance-like MFS transporter